MQDWWLSSRAMTFWAQTNEVDGTPAKSGGGAPSCLVAYGENNVQAIVKSGLGGKLIRLKGQNE